MKNTLETKSETSDRNDGCPKISHTPSVSVKGRSPVLMGALMLSPRMLLQQRWGPSAAAAAAVVQNWRQDASLAWKGRKAAGLVPRLALTCGTDFS